MSILKDKSEKVTLTRKEFREVCQNVLMNPFEGDKIDDKSRAELQMTLFITGMLITRKLEDKIFGKEEEK